jgi:hypothetical protein
MQLSQPLWEDGIVRRAFAREYGALLVESPRIMSRSSPMKRNSTWIVTLAIKMSVMGSRITQVVLFAFRDSYSKACIIERCNIHPRV